MSIFLIHFFPFILCIVKLISLFAWSKKILGSSIDRKRSFSIYGSSINPLTAVSAYLRKAEGPSQKNSLKINCSLKN